MDTREWIKDKFGSSVVVEDRSRAVGRRTHLLRLETTDGSRFFLKRHEHRRHFEAEVEALTSEMSGWAREGWSIPELVAVEWEAGFCVVTHLPGTHTIPDAGFEAAGRFAARLHRSAFRPAVSPPRNYTVELAAQRLESCSSRLTQAPSWVGRPWSDAGEVLARVRVWLGRLELTELRLVPTHGDFSPRNWVWDPKTDTIGILDWERTRMAPWQEDVHRMVGSAFRERSFENAFWAGFGGRPDATPLEALRAIAAIDALAAIPWALDREDRDFFASSLDRLWWLCA